MKIKPSNKPGGVVGELRTSEAQLPTAASAASARPLPVFQLKKILVPVDFSDCSQKALQYALPFARQFNANLELLHVVETYLPTAGLVAVNLDLTRDQMLAMARKDFEALRQTLPEDVVSEGVVCEGAPRIEIIEAAKQSSADLIILSTHGRTGLARVCLGSTAEYVVRHAPCPVLVVRECEHEFVADKVAGSEK